ncbi:hypothetical protein HK102_000583 [Quaeritorhiza haematococci]|nr:hypothetical protein HK102_000583 [Quaeritorhiza haematococci]
MTSTVAMTTTIATPVIPTTVASASLTTVGPTVGTDVFTTAVIPTPTAHNTTTFSFVQTPIGTFTTSLSFTTIPLPSTTLVVPPTLSLFITATPTSTVASTTAVPTFTTESTTTPPTVTKTAPAPPTLPKTTAGSSGFNSPTTVTTVTTTIAFPPPIVTSNLQPFLTHFTTIISSGGGWTSKEITTKVARSTWLETLTSGASSLPPYLTTRGYTNGGSTEFEAVPSSGTSTRTWASPTLFSESRSWPVAASTITATDPLQLETSSETNRKTTSFPILNSPSSETWLVSRTATTTETEQGISSTSVSEPEPTPFKTSSSISSGWILEVSTTVTWTERGVSSTRRFGWTSVTGAEVSQTAPTRTPAAPTPLTSEQWTSSSDVSTTFAESGDASGGTLSTSRSVPATEGRVVITDMLETLTEMETTYRSNPTETTWNSDGSSTEIASITNSATSTLWSTTTVTGNSEGWSTESEISTTYLESVPPPTSSLWTSISTWSSTNRAETSGSETGTSLERAATTTTWNSESGSAETSTTYFESITPLPTSISWVSSTNGAETWRIETDTFFEPTATMTTWNSESETSPTYFESSTPLPTSNPWISTSMWVPRSNGAETWRSETETFFESTATTTTWISESVSAETSATYFESITPLPTPTPWIASSMWFSSTTDAETWASGTVTSFEPIDSTWNSEGVSTETEISVTHLESNAVPTSNLWISFSTWASSTGGAETRSETDALSEPTATAASWSSQSGGWSIETGPTSSESITTIPPSDLWISSTDAAETLSETEIVATVTETVTASTFSPASTVFSSASGPTDKWVSTTHADFEATSTQLTETFATLGTKTTTALTPTSVTLTSVTDEWGPLTETDLATSIWSPDITAASTESTFWITSTSLSSVNEEWGSRTDDLLNSMQFQTTSEVATSTWSSDITATMTGGTFWISPTPTSSSWMLVRGEASVDGFLTSAQFHPASESATSTQSPDTSPTATEAILFPPSTHTPLSSSISVTDEQIFNTDDLVTSMHLQFQSASEPSPTHSKSFEVWSTQIVATRTESTLTSPPTSTAWISKTDSSVSRNHAATDTSRTPDPPQTSSSDHEAASPEMSVRPTATGFQTLSFSTFWPPASMHLKSNVATKTHGSEASTLTNTFELHTNINIPTSTLELGTSDPLTHTHTSMSPEQVTGTKDVPSHPPSTVTIASLHVSATDVWMSSTSRTQSHIEATTTTTAQKAKTAFDWIGKETTQTTLSSKQSMRTTGTSTEMQKTSATTTAEQVGARSTTPSTYTSSTTTPHTSDSPKPTARLPQPTLATSNLTTTTPPALPIKTMADTSTLLPLESTPATSTFIPTTTCLCRPTTTQTSTSSCPSGSISGKSMWGNALTWISEYNLFALQDVVGWSCSIQGRLAAGRNLSLQHRNSIGSKLFNPKKTCPQVREHALQQGVPALQYTVVVGGGYEGLSGWVNNGGVAVPAVGENRTVSAGFSWGSKECEIAQLSTSPIDFSAAGTYLNKLSAALSLLPTTGWYSRSGTTLNIHLNGTYDYEVITLDAKHLSQGRKIVLKGTFTETATLVFNIPTTSHVWIGHISLNFLTNSQRNRVIWNMPHANELWLHKMTMYGLILAPHAALRDPSYSVYGQVFVRKFVMERSGSASMKWCKFTGCLPDVDEKCLCR